MWRGEEALKAAIISVLSLLAEPCLQAHTCPPNATAVGVGLSATGFRVRDPGSVLSPIGFLGVGPCEKIKIGGRLNYLPIGFGGQTMAPLWGGPSGICRAGGSYWQGVPQVGGVPLPGPPGAACNPPVV